MPLPSIDSIQTKEDLSKYILALADDLKQNPDKWDNPTLDRYLEAMSAWVKDIDGYFRNHNQTPPTTPSWKTIAQMLQAASIYE